MKVVMGGMGMTGPGPSPAGHEHLPLPGSCYSEATQLPADMRRPSSYPVTAVCSCGQAIRCPTLDAPFWEGTGRKAGEP